MTVDFHTHNPHAGDAIIAVEPHLFEPEPGLLYSVGVHPWRTDQVDAREMSLLDEVARHPQVVAIGETGMDSLRGAPLARQSQVFAHHLDLARQLDKPIIIHSVRTSQQVLAMIRRQNLAVPCAIHGMRGNERVARPLIEAGLYLSFGPRFNPAAVRATPVHRLLIETDDSGLSIAEVAATLAPVLGLTADQLLTQAATNLAAFLHHPQ